MSGLAALVGHEARPEVASSLANAAPHRGKVKEVHGGRGWALALQEQDGAHPFLRTGLCLEKGLVTALAGCLYRGGTVLFGNAAAAEIAAAFQAGGSPMVAQLKGSFAAIILEPDGKKAVGIRSAVGERPLFWRRAGLTFGFASEVKQLAAFPLPAPTMDEGALLDVVALRFEQPAQTPYRQIRRVLAGTWLEADERGHRTDRFWDLSDKAGNLQIHLDDAVQEFRRLFRQSICRRLTDESALLLSGGLDSSAIAAEASPPYLSQFRRPLRVVSAGYPQYDEVDESSLIRQTRDALGLDLACVRPSALPFSEAEDQARLHDGMNFAPLPENFREILRQARDAGFSQFMDGHDADTLLGFSGSVLTELVRRRRFHLLRPFIRSRRARLDLGAVAAVRHIVLPAFLDYLPVARALERKVRRPRACPPWLFGELKERMNFQSPIMRPAQDYWRRVIGPVSLGYELLERLALSERVSLVHPFADPELVDFLVSLPVEIKFAGGAPKSLLRHVFPALPPDVLNRQDKTAFDALASGWAVQKEILGQVSQAAKLVPGVNWVSLEERLRTLQVPVQERVLIGRVLCCDHFLAQA